MLFSLPFVYSASWAFAQASNVPAGTLFLSHAWKVLLGLVLIIVCAKIDYHFWRKFSKFALAVAILSLAILLFFGAEVKGANRWLDLGFIKIQPSELVKLTLVLHFASMLAAKQKVIKSFQLGFIPFMIWITIISVLIAFQPDLSTIVIIFSIAFTMMFVGNVNLIYLILSGIIALVSFGLYAVSAEYRMNRILSYFGLDDGIAGASYQLNQSLIAIGNGGFFGLGTGQSRQSMLFLPESYTDFIFAIIGEEYGFVGLLLILSAFGLIFWRGLRIAKNAPDNFGYFLATGIIITFAFNVFVNAGVNTGLLPTTGQALPFISYGGTAILLYSVAIGILLNISSQAGVFSAHPKEE